MGEFTKEFILIIVAVVLSSGLSTYTTTNQMSVHIDYLRSDVSSLNSRILKIENSL